MIERPKQNGLLFLVVFGAAVRPDGSPSGVLRRRVDGALAAALDDPAARFVVTGGEGHHAPAEAIVMADLLRAAGVPDAHIVIEPESRDTLESALRCARLIAAHWQPGSRVLSCSSPSHNPRCAALLRLLGIPAIRAAMPSDRPHITLRRLIYQVVRESAALPFDVVLLVGMLIIGRARRAKLEA